jgi:hypothetical protein
VHVTELPPLLLGLRLLGLRLLGLRLLGLPLLLLLELHGHSRQLLTASAGTTAGKAVHTVSKPAAAVLQSLC